MVSLNLTDEVFFNNGVSGASDVVGVSSGNNRVVRYKFISPPEGASSVSISIENSSAGNGSTPAALRFYIGTDPNSHINAGSTSLYTGDFVAKPASAYYTYTGEADILLLPEETYYLFVFPATTTFGWMYWYVAASLTAIGGAGLVRIYTKSGWVMATPYIDTGKDWNRVLTYIDTGNSWAICI